MIDIDTLDFTRGGGLVTVVTQDSRTGQVLMVAHADREALQKTIETGEMHYRSRSRGLWHKGETSGNTQRVVSLTADCDGDSVLARVTPAGPACHNGTRSCFGESIGSDVFTQLAATIDERAKSLEDESDGSYTKRLLRHRNLRLKKLGEESAELVTACADEDRERAVEEAADLFYHALVALRSLGADVTDVTSALEKRFTVRA